jgi:hypothetical protein
MVFQDRTLRGFQKQSATGMVPFRNLNGEMVQLHPDDVRAWKPGAPTS